VNKEFEDDGVEEGDGVFEAVTELEGVTNGVARLALYSSGANTIPRSTIPLEAVTITVVENVLGTKRYAVMDVVA